jgi:alkylation response protein AidB-like acyl-CoA dehydrogenase
VEFEFDEDQRLLQRSVRETLAKTRALPEDQQWSTYLELGWLEAPPVELAIVLEELGYIADPTPFLATATWFAPLAGRLPEGSGAGGNGTYAGAGTAVFDGAGRYVLDADRAGEVALLTGDGVRVVPAGELEIERVGTFDQRLHVGHVTGAGAAGTAGLVPGVPDLALMGLAVSTVGACRKILDMTVAYVKQRHQFGVPIGSFQAVKHKAADMYVAIERARALAYYSALTLAEASPDDASPRAHTAALMAKAAAGECQEVVFANGLQLHGAIGFTWENELHFYLKRAVAGDLLLGTASVHRKALLTDMRQGKETAAA